MAVCMEYLRRSHGRQTVGNVACQLQFTHALASVATKDAYNSSPSESAAVSSGNVNRGRCGRGTADDAGCVDFSAASLLAPSGSVLRIRWLRTAASYQLKLNSGFEAKRPRVRSASARRSSSNKKM